MNTEKRTKGKIEGKIARKIGTDTIFSIVFSFDMLLPRRSYFFVVSVPSMLSFPH